LPRQKTGPPSPFTGPVGYKFEQQKNLERKKTEKLFKTPKIKERGGVLSRGKRTTTALSQDAQSSKALKVFKKKISGKLGGLGKEKNCDFQKLQRSVGASGEPFL